MWRLLVPHGTAGNIVILVVQIHFGFFLRHHELSCATFVIGACGQHEIFQVLIGFSVSLEATP